MRKLWRSLLLVLALLVSQQGGLLHELQHVVGASRTAAASSGSTSSPKHESGALCEACLAFAHLAGIAHGSAFAGVLLATADHWVGAEPFAVRDSDAPAHAARDPPTRL